MLARFSLLAFTIASIAYSTVSITPENTRGVTLDSSGRARTAMNGSRPLVESGKWKLLIGKPSDKRAEVSLEIEITPSCQNTVAVYYASGTERGLAPGNGKNGFLSFAFGLDAKRFIADLAPSVATGKMEGVVTDFHTEEQMPAEAEFIGTGSSFEMVAVTASANAAPVASGSEETAVWLIRSPTDTHTPGDVVFHKTAPGFFSCYGLDNKNPGAQAFAYSDGGLFTVPLTDAKSENELKVWMFHGEGTVLQQREPFIVSLVNKGNSVDFVKRAPR